ncbi:MAG TPA: hypothetical protein VJT82_07990 [Pyrinomonadaceae bacterium]|nr:hypothetical protein [Pyrinomonadaceae bacterium]
MQRDRAVFALKMLTRALASVALLLAIPVLSRAQGAPGVAPTGPRIDPEKARIRDEQRREMQLRNLKEGTSAPANEGAVRAAAEQLNHDFKRIQVIRNDVARALIHKSTLDYGRISEQATEVRKRAVRMQSYLALHVAGKDEKSQQPGEIEFDEGQMKSALVKLCHRIDSFVANPRFTTPGVVDVEGTAKASRDLQEIISLSTNIKNNVEKLGRAHE